MSKRSWASGLPYRPSEKTLPPTVIRAVFVALCRRMIGNAPEGRRPIAVFSAMKGSQKGRTLRFTLLRLNALAGTPDLREVICTCFQESIDQWAAQDSNL